MDNAYVTAVINLLILSCVIFAVAKLLPAITIKSFATAVVVAVAYSVINILLDMALKYFPMINNVFAVGLVRVLVNAALLGLTSLMIKDFKIKGFGWTLVASILITLACMLISYFFPIVNFW